MYILALDHSRFTGLLDSRTVICAPATTAAAAPIVSVNMRIGAVVG